MLAYLCTSRCCKEPDEDDKRLADEESGGQRPNIARPVAIAGQIGNVDHWGYNAANDGVDGTHEIPSKLTTRHRYFSQIEINTLEFYQCPDHGGGVCDR